MSNPVTIQNHVYTGFTGGTEVVSTSFAYGVPDWVSIRIYEASDPDTLLTFTQTSEQVFEVNHDASLPANGTLVVALDVPYDELVRIIADGNVFKEDTQENLFIQAIMVAATIAEGRIPALSEPLDMSNFKVINAANPTSAQDLVTKAFADANYGGTAASDAEAAKIAAEDAQAAAEAAEAIAVAARDAANSWATEDEDVLVSDGVNPDGYSSFHWAKKSEAARDVAVANQGLVEASSADTTPGTLDDKINVSGAISKSIGSPGGDETIELDSPVQAGAVQNVILQNNASDAEHDIDVLRQDTDRPALLTLQDSLGNVSFLAADLSSTTARLDDTWDGVGTGGMASGASLGADAVFYGFIVANDAGTLKVIFDDNKAGTNVFSTTSASGYNRKAYIGAVVTDASSNILPGSWREMSGGVLQFTLDTLITEQTGGASTDQALTNLTTTAPPNTLPLLRAMVENVTNGRDIIIYFYDRANDTPFMVINTASGGSQQLGYNAWVFTNASRQIGYSWTQTGGYNGTYYFILHGWREFR